MFDGVSSPSAFQYVSLSPYLSLPVSLCVPLTHCLSASLWAVFPSSVPAATSAALAAPDTSRGIEPGDVIIAVNAESVAGKVCCDTTHSLSPYPLTRSCVCGTGPSLLWLGCVLFVSAILEAPLVGVRTKFCLNNSVVLCHARVAVCIFHWYLSPTCSSRALRAPLALCSAVGTH